MIEAKLVGPYKFTALMAFLYASTTPSSPSTSGSKMFPLSAKQCEALLVYGGIEAPKPNVGIYLSES